MTPTLLSLAPELVYGIADRVNKKDVGQLRLTCKYLSDVLESQALRTIHFSIQHHNYNEATTKLQYLATTKSRGLSRSGRHLHIGPLSPHPPSSFKLYNCAGDEILLMPEPEDRPEVLVVEERMRTYLGDALDALQSLQSVTWSPEERDEAWTHEIVMDFLASRRFLHTLKVKLSLLRVALPLNRMQNLREITFTERSGYLSCRPIRIKTYNNLAKFLASCPAGQITKLSVVLTSLHEIFQYLTSEVEPLRLKDLRMTESFINLDSLTIPHLRHLTCLHLLSMKSPSPSNSERGTSTSHTSDDMSSDSSDDPENEENNVGSKMTDVWSHLHRVGIHLREIRADNINAGLLGYLTHYTGLTKLVISTNGFGSFPESDAFARRFFAEALTSHAETLEELAIYSVFEDLWCFGEHNLSAFSHCKWLMKLGLSVARANLPRAKRRGPRGYSGNYEVRTDQNQPGIVKTLLDMVSTHMPRLSQLSISDAYIRGERRQGTTRRLHGIRNAITQCPIQCLLAYRIPPSSALVQFPRVSIRSKRFEPRFVLSSFDEMVGGERGRGRRYQEIKETEDWVADKD